MSTQTKKYRLANGMNIFHMNKSETDLIYREIFEDKIYLLGGLDIQDGDVIIDIGGNIGLFLLFATQHAEHVKVYSFEPIPATFNVLQQNAPQNNGHQIHLFNQGVSDKKGSAVFRFLPRFSCASSMHPDDSPEQQQRAKEFTLNAFEVLPNRRLARLIRLLPQFARNWLANRVIAYHHKAVEVKCELTSVSDIIRENRLDRVDYLKLDAEGAEIDVLSGIADEHWPLIKQIAVETHRGDEMLAHVVNILKSRGFVTHTDFSPSSPADKMAYGRRP